MSSQKKISPSEKKQSPAVQPELPLSTEPQKKKFPLKSILFLFGFLLYANTIPFDYALDDKLYITHNEFTKKGFSGIKDILTTDLFVGFYGRQKNLVAGGRYRPLSLVTFAIEYQVFGKNPHIGHFVNAVLYGFTAVLLFVILSRLFPRAQAPNPKSQIPNSKFQILSSQSHISHPTSHISHLISHISHPTSHIFSIPFLTTLLFIAHPLHTEIVANIKSRDELMSFLGALAALYFVLKFLGVHSSQFTVHSSKLLASPFSIFHFPFSLKYIFYASLCFFAALLSKETTVTFLAIIPLTLWFFTNQSLKKIILTVLPLILVFGIYTAIRYAFLGAPRMEPLRELMNDPFIHASVSQKYGTIFFTLGLYVRLLFFPHPLTHDYYPWHPLADDSYKWGGNIFPYVELTDPKALLPLLFYLGIFIYALIGLRKKSVFSYGILFFLGTFFLTSNLIFPIGTFMNERFMYIPSLGFCLILVFFLLNILPQKIKNAAACKTTLFAAVGALCLFYSAKTIARNYAWENDYALATTDVKTSPNSAKVRMSAGGSMLDKAKEEKNPAEKQRMLNQSIQHLYRSLELYPTYIQPMLLMGNAYYEAKDYNNSIVFFENCLKIDGNYEYAVNNLLHIGDTCTKLGMFETAIKSLDALTAHNRNVRAYQMLGELYGKNLGNLGKSSEYLQKALEIDPDNTNTLQKLGVVHAMKGEPQKAIEIFNKALEIEPENAHIMMNLGITLNQLGQKEKGQEYLDKAFRLNPELKR